MGTTEDEAIDDAPHEDVDLLRTGDIVAEKYRIDRTIGQGGMGRVYAATHVMTGKPVALKWLLPKNAQDSRAVTRFLREARAVGAVDHPNVVNIFDVGRHDSAPFLVMELLRGRPLSDVVGEKPVPAATLIGLIMPALRGIQAAHQKGIVHRDLKPENIFLCDDVHGHARQAKVLDFGISKAFDDSAPELHSVTRSGAIIGTPHYMSPEQIRGMKDIDARTDIYAIGVILYEGLTGRRPFEGETFTALAVEIATASIPLPRTIVPDLDPALEAVVMRTLAREPSARFSSVARLARALEPFAPGVRFSEHEGESHEPVSSSDEENRTREFGSATTLPRTTDPPQPEPRSPTTTERPPIPESGARTWVIALAALAALGLAVGIVAWILDGSGDAPPPVREPEAVREPSPPTPEAPEREVTRPAREAAPIVQASQPDPLPIRRRPPRATDTPEEEAPAGTSPEPRRADGVRTDGVSADEF